MNFIYLCILIIWGPIHEFPFTDIHTQCILGKLQFTAALLWTSFFLILWRDLNQGCLLLRRMQ
jgi:hypothetical protein